MTKKSTSRSSKAASGTQQSESQQQAAAAESFSPTDLRLDNRNPRLNPSDKGKSESQIIKIMIERFAIAEIAESICSAGFLPIDPLIGCREGKHVTILEGNRRLATVKLLLDPSLAPESYRETWHDFSKRVSKASREAMNQLRVTVYQDRRSADVLAYIGYRHVNGVMSWEAEEKAAYVASLVEDNIDPWSYDVIAQKLGSKRSHIEKLYVAHRLIEQARDEDMPGHQQMRAKFGVLTRALQATGVPQFLKVDFPNNPKRSRTPARDVRNLQDFVRWTFGTGKERPVLEDSRDLTKWGQILRSAESVRYLRTNPEPRFDRAFARSGGLRDNLVDSLILASDQLQESVPLVQQHRDDPDVIKAVQSCKRYFDQIIAHFPSLEST